MENNLPKTIITCPHCGAQFTLEELFEAGDILGWPEDIVRDPLNKIIYCSYKKDAEPTYATKFICDFCDRPFNVDLKITATATKEDEALDFSNTTASLF